VRSGRVLEIQVSRAAPVYWLIGLEGIAPKPNGRQNETEFL
jgi:hypothetical protein